MKNLYGNKRYRLLCSLLDREDLHCKVFREGPKSFSLYVNGTILYNYKKRDSANKRLIALFQNKYGMIDPKTLKRLKESFKRSPIKIKKRLEIINFFLTNKNNTVPEICRKLNVSPQIAHSTLNKFFEIIQTKNQKPQKQ